VAGHRRDEVVAGIRKRLSKKGAEIVERAEKAFHAVSSTPSSTRS